MNVLWFVNIPLPAVLSYKQWRPAGSGWWLSGLADEFAKDGSIKLTIANCDPRYKEFERYSSGGIEYRLIPADNWNIVGWKSARLVKTLAEIVNESNADIVDVHGSEYVYGQITPLVRKPVVITIQLFMKSVWERPWGRISLAGVLTRQTRSKADIKAAAASVYGGLANYLRMKSEKKIFRWNKYFIGRTEWDRKVTMELTGGKGQYFTCWEILREPFYKTKWQGPISGNQTIFACSRCTPAKGFADLIEVVAKLQGRFENIRLKLTAGKSESWGRYLARLAAKLGISERVEFCGYLTGEKMAQEMSSSAVYAHASYQDNSPNSLAEAMCIGLDCVAATTGGIPSMIRDGHDGLLFDTGNIGQLAEKISLTLADKELAERLGQNARTTALQRHNPAKVARETFAAYEAVLRDYGNGL